MNKIDKAILEVLLKNAKASMNDIANVCGLSIGAVHQRIKKLEEQNIIKAYKIILDTERIGLSTMAFIGVFLEKAGLYHKVVNELNKIEEIVECSFTTGNYSLLLKVYCRDNKHLMQVLSDKVQTIEGVARTETFISLEHPIERPLNVNTF